MRMAPWFILLARTLLLLVRPAVALCPWWRAVSLVPLGDSHTVLDLSMSHDSQEEIRIKAHTTKLFISECYHLLLVVCKAYMQTDFLSILLSNKRMNYYE